MTITIQSSNQDIDDLNLPNGFWPAFCVETPVSGFLGCRYKDESKSVIIYEHSGYTGTWFTNNEALEMYNRLTDFIQTSDFKNHSYFSSRINQMDAILEFLPKCGGFRIS